VETRFTIKKNYHQDFYTFYDLSSDFSARLDKEGMSLVQGVFSKKGNGYSEKEKGIIAILLAKKILHKEEDIVLYGIPTERDGTSLVRVEIEITKRCNLRCKHCFTENAASDTRKELIESLVPDLQSLGVVEVDLNGGEPFLHPDIAKILSSISGKFKTVLFSNGLCIDEEKIELIQKYHVARVNISLDGFRESHDYLRGNGTYNKTVEVIKNLTSKGILVQLNTMVFSRNIGDLENFIQYSQTELGVCGVRVANIYPLGNALSHSDLLEDNKSTREIYEKYLRESMQGPVTGKHLPCAAGVTQLFLNVHGQIYPCRLFEGTKYNVGDLQNRSLRENYFQFLKTPSYFTDFKIENLKGCTNCKLLSICKAGCRARASLLQHDINAPDTFACKCHGLF
jgi:radical SAM protein with 4Fe4S-binding SPASM domain